MAFGFREGSKQGCGVGAAPYGWVPLLRKDWTHMGDSSLSACKEKTWEGCKGRFGLGEQTHRFRCCAIAFKSDHKPSCGEWVLVGSSSLNPFALNSSLWATASVLLQLQTQSCHGRCMRSLRAAFGFPESPSCFVLKPTHCKKHKCHEAAAPLPQRLQGVWRVRWGRVCDGGGAQRGQGWGEIRMEHLSQTENLERVAGLCSGGTSPFLCNWTRWYFSIKVT